MVCAIKLADCYCLSLITQLVVCCALVVVAVAAWSLVLFDFWTEWHNIQSRIALGRLGPFSLCLLGLVPACITCFIEIEEESGVYTHYTPHHRGWMYIYLCCSLKWGSTATTTRNSSLPSVCPQRRYLITQLFFIFLFLSRVLVGINERNDGDDDDRNLFGTEKEEILYYVGGE